MKRHRILIIDDEEDIREILEDALYSQDERETISVGDGNAGFSRAKNESIDLVLLDLCLPDVNGLEVCRWLKQDPKTQAIPVVLMTGKQTTDDKRRGLQMGAVDYINKPFNLNELIERITSLLKQQTGPPSQDSGVTTATTSPDQRVIERIRQGLESSTDALCLVNDAGNAIFQNRSFHLMFELHPEALLSSDRYTAFFKDNVVWKQLWSSCRAGNPWRGEVELQTVTGKTITPLCRASPIWDESHQFCGILFLFTDISHLKRFESDLLYQATHDPLTDLYNRRFFDEVLTHAVNNARRGHVCTLLYLDLDNFKVVNDTEGHEAGDRLLMKIAQLLRAHTRKVDQLARFGGDEFVLLLEHTDIDGATQVAKKLLEAIDGFRHLENEKFIGISASIGIALIDGTHSSEQVLAHADMACYLAKRQGKKGFMVYNEQNAEITRFTEEANWSLDIDHALAENRFEIWLQPLFSLKTNGYRRPNFFEALVRMRDTEGNLVLPGTIIPAAERFGKIIQIDKWMIERAVDFLHEQPHATVAVNLSAHSLNNPAIARFAQDLAERKGFTPNSLCLEITETGMLRSLDAACSAIAQLKKLGFGFALDDFGAGFSMLHQIRYLPVDFIKIDGQFIHDLNQDNFNQMVVKSISEIAQSQGKAVVAECVETTEDLAILRKLPIDFAQGFYFQAPKPLSNYIGSDGM